MVIVITVGVVSFAMLYFAHIGLTYLFTHFIVENIRNNAQVYPS